MITDIVYPLKQATRKFQSFYLVIWLICVLYRYTSVSHNMTYTRDQSMHKASS